MGVLAPCPSSASRSRIGLAAHQGAPPRSQRDASGAGRGARRGRAASCPISLSVAFERLRTIRSFYFFLAGHGGARLRPLQRAALHEPLPRGRARALRMGAGRVRRPWSCSPASPPSPSPRRGPTACSAGALRGDARSSASSSPAFGVFIVVGLYMPVGGLGRRSSTPSASPCRRRPSSWSSPITSSVIPYRLRSRGTAMVGSLHLPVRRLLRRRAHRAARRRLRAARRPHDHRAARPRIIGGALIAYGARYIRGDISRCVEELLEEKDEADRVRQDDAATPAIQVRNLDFSYGTVQVLFDVNLDVRRRRDGGAPRHQRRRQVDAPAGDQRARRRQPRASCASTAAPSPTPIPSCARKVGVVQLMGGNAIFPALSVDENLRMAGFLYDDAELQPAHRGGAGAASRAGRAPPIATPATCPGASSRCWPWRWRWCTSPTC